MMRGLYQLSRAVSKSAPVFGPMEAMAVSVPKRAHRPVSTDATKFERDTAFDENEWTNTKAHIKAAKQREEKLKKAKEEQEKLANDHAFDVNEFAQKVAQLEKPKKLEQVPVSDKPVFDKVFPDNGQDHTFDESDWPEKVAHLKKSVPPPELETKQFDKDHAFDVNEPGIK